MLIPLLLLLFSPSSSAATFATTKAIAQTAGATCKKARVELTQDTILVECKKDGYSRRLSELLDLQWSIRGGSGTMTAQESGGASFVVSVKKKEFRSLKAVLLANLNSESVVEDSNAE